MRKAIAILLIFLGLSVGQRLTGIGSQPQLVCKLRNTFQMNTSIKRNPNAITSSSDESTLLDSFGIRDFFQRWCKSADSGGTGGRGLKSLVSPFKALFKKRDVDCDFDDTSESCSRSTCSSESSGNY